MSACTHPNNDDCWTTHVDMDAQSPFVFVDEREGLGPGLSEGKDKHERIVSIRVCRRV